MLVYLVRHGLSVSNAARKHSGSIDVPLAEEGFAEARHLSPCFEGIPFDAVYASNMLRAQQTARTVLPGCEFTADERLREVDMGTLSDRTREDCLSEYGETYLKALKDRDFSVFSGESTKQQMERTKEFLNDLEKQSDSLGKVAVFCHEGTVKSAVSLVLGCDYIRNFTLPNCSVCVICFKNGKWYFKQAAAVAGGLVTEE